jgi:hypothetical protein
MPRLLRVESLVAQPPTLEELFLRIRIPNQGLTLLQGVRRRVVWEEIREKPLDFSERFPPQSGRPQ